VEFTRELAFTNNAAETAEGATKPETSITFELANAPVRTIAHWIKLSRQVMDDAPAVASYVDTRLRYGVERRIDAQLIAGNGVGQNLSGLTNSGNFTAFTPVTGDTALDSLNKAKYLIEASDYSATAIVMNPADWGAIERNKTSYGEYVIGDPRSAIGPVLWGLPVVVSNSMVSGKLLVGAFDIAAQVWNREGVAVEMTESNDTDFVKNLVTVRAEARLALAVYRPASVYYGNLTL
jgi:HK97 family phage major capsid protein